MKEQRKMLKELFESKCRKSGHLIHGIRAAIKARVVRDVALSFRLIMIILKITKPKNKVRKRTIDLLTQLRVNAHLWLFLHVRSSRKFMSLINLRLILQVK